MRKLIYSAAVLLISAPFANAQITVLPNGNVGIGVTTPTNKLQVSGLAADFLNTSQLRLGVFAADPRIQSSTSKVVFYNMANTGHVAVEVKNVIMISDEKTKSNVTPLGNNALDIVKQLKPVTYRFKVGDDQKVHSGFLAQDIEKVLPNLVHKNDSLDIKGVAYLELIPYLVEAIKEQQKTIESLQTKLSAANTSFDSDATYANLLTVASTSDIPEDNSGTANKDLFVNNRDGVTKD